MSAQLQQHCVASALAPPRDAAYRLGRLAVGALYAELACAPKPGLVTPFDSGSHTDMDAATFVRSLFALRGYFVAIAQAGIDHAPFERLRELGIAAESAMLRATCGVNTHRGAIFSLGLLTAQAARLRGEQRRRPTAEQVCDGVRAWRDALQAAPLTRTAMASACVRNTASVACANRPRQGIRCCARSPCLRCVPRLRGATREAALVQTLMQLIAQVDDLNLLHRGGPEGLAFAKAQATAFLPTAALPTRSGARSCMPSASSLSPVA